MRPQFVCHPHSHSHFHSHTPTDVSRLDRYRFPNMVIPPEHPSAVGTAGFNRTPLAELSAETRRQLACMLNRKKVLRSEEGYERDWRGIASLAGQRNDVNEDANMPMDLVLDSWIRNNPQSAEVGNLEEFLGIIDRWDVRDDIQENLTKDTNRYNLKQQQQAEQLALSCDSPTPKVKCMERNNNVMGRDVNILSYDDEKCLQNGQPLPKYNACVLYAEADIEHATDIMNNLESPAYNLKLFLRHRDLLLGVPFEHVLLSQFMATRCKHLIIVMTKEFQKSRENTYLVNFTQKLQIENHSHKIITILYEPNMVIPPTLAIYTHITYYTEISSLFNFWDRVARSLQDVDPSCIYSSSQQNTPTTPEPTAPPETPRICINGTDVTDLPDMKLMEPNLKCISGDTTAPLPELKIKRKDKLLQKFTLNFGTSPRNGTTVKPLKHAHSFSAINAQENESTLNASISNLSACSENNKKRSNKWTSKLMKKFTRSSTKLQTPC